MEKLNISACFPQFYIVWEYLFNFLNLFQHIQRLERCSEVCCVNYEQDFVHRVKNKNFHSGNFKSVYMYFLKEFLNGKLYFCIV